MNGSNPLFRRMTLAGYGAAVTAGAVTVALIAGVAHSGKTWTSSGGASTKGATSTSDDGNENESDDSGSSGTGVINAPQNNAPVGGSNGS